jgi:hypothetical protein
VKIIATAQYLHLHQAAESCFGSIWKRASREEDSCELSPALGQRGEPRDGAKIQAFEIIAYHQNVAPFFR